MQLAQNKFHDGIIINVNQVIRGGQLSTVAALVEAKYFQERFIAQAVCPSTRGFSIENFDIKAFRKDVDPTQRIDVFELQLPRGTAGTLTSILDQFQDDSVINPLLDEANGADRIVRRGCAASAQGIGDGNNVIILRRGDHTNDAQLIIGHIVNIEFEAPELACDGINRGGAVIWGGGVDKSGADVCVRLVDLGSTGRRQVNLQLLDDPVAVDRMPPIFSEGIVPATKFSIDKKVFVAQVMAVLNDQRLAELVGFGRFLRALNGGNGRDIERSQLGYGLDPKQPFAAATASGGELGAGQGERDVACINRLEDLILVTFVSNLHGVFPFEDILAVLMNGNIDTIAYTAGNVKSLGLVHIQVPITAGPEIGNTFFLFLELDAAVNGDITGHLQ